MYGLIHTEACDRFSERIDFHFPALLLNSSSRMAISFHLVNLHGVIRQKNGSTTAGWDKEFMFLPSKRTVSPISHWPPLMIRLSLTILSLAIPAGSLADEFHGGNPVPLSSLGGDPSICKDPQIARIEEETNTTARVFPPGPVSRSWEIHGNATPAVCQGSPAHIVEFIPKKLYARVSQSVQKSNTKPGTPGFQPLVPKLDNSLPSPGNAPFKLNAQERGLPPPRGLGDSAGIDYNTYRPLSLGIDQGRQDGPSLRVLYGKMMIPHDKQPIRFTVQPDFQVTYTDPTRLGAIRPNIDDNFVSARGYMRGPMTLEVRDLKLKSGRYMRPELVHLYYNPPR